MTKRSRNVALVAINSGKSKEVREIWLTATASTDLPRRKPGNSGQAEIAGYCLLRGEKRNVCNSLSVENPFIGELPPGFSCPPALPLSLLCTGQTMGR